MAIYLSVFSRQVAVAQLADASDVSCVYLSICPPGGLWLSHIDLSKETDHFLTVLATPIAAALSKSTIHATNVPVPQIVFSICLSQTRRSRTWGDHNWRDPLMF